MGDKKILQVIVRLFIVAVLLVVGWFAFYYVVWLTFPFIIAAFIAFFINPIVNFLEKIARFPRTLAVLSGMLFLFGLVGGVLTLIIIKLVDGFRYLSRLVPTQIETISIHIQAYVNEHIFPLWVKGVGLIDGLEVAQRDAVENSIQQLGGSLPRFLEMQVKRLPMVSLNL